jgi:hypothetical protein
MAIAEHFPEYPPYAGAHAEVIPHLTVAQTQDAPFDDLAEIERHLPIQCVAREAWLMMEDGDHRWSTRSRFVFADGARG